MAIWYEGNRNNEQNRREKDGVVYYIRGLREVNGVRYERYGVKTHFIGRGEDYIEILRQYVLPLYQPGDIVTLGEKVISMCQDNTVEKQLAINMKGLPLVLWGAFWGAVCKVFGKRGVFYEIVGQDVAGIDGFYSHSAFETYHDLAVLNPRDPDKVCAEIQEKLGISCVLVDANDIAVEILAKSPDLAAMEDDTLAETIRDNPAGQDDELTPFILIRDIGDAEAEPFVPLVAIDKPNH